MMRSIVAVTVVAVSIAVAGCAKKNKVELIYEEPVTRAWSGAEQQPAPPPPQNTAVPTQMAPAPGYQQAPPQGYPPQGPPPQGYPPQPPPRGYSQQAPQGYPPQQTGYPQQPPPYPPQGQAPAQPPGAWRGAGPAPPPVATDPTAATTVVVPDPNPTTQTTLKRRTGWVRGGYD